MQATDIIGRDQILLRLAVPSKAELLKALAQRAAKDLGLDWIGIHAALKHREDLGSTGVGLGVAMPHAPMAGIERPYGLLATLERPVPFEAIDDVPIDIACLLLTPRDAPRDHLNALSCVAKRLRSAAVLADIRAAKSPEQLYAALMEPC